MKKLLAIITSALLLLAMVPAGVLSVTADTITTVNDMELLGYGFNMLGDTHINNKSTARQIFVSMDNLMATVTDLSHTSTTFTYISDMHSYLNNSKTSGGFSIKPESKIKMISLDIESKYKMENSGSDFGSKNTELSVIQINASREKYELRLDNEMQIARVWQQDENGNYTVLDRDFVYSLLNDDPAVFFELWGSHIITRYTAGGQAYASYQGSDMTHTVTGASSWESNTSASLGIGELFKIKVGLDLAASEDHTNTTEGKVKQTVMEVTGGDGGSFSMNSLLEGGDAAVNSWISSLKADNNLEILNDEQLKMLPIWELLIQDEYADRRVELEEYFNENLDEDFAKYYGKYVYGVAGKTDYADYTFVQTAEDLHNIRNDLNGKYVLLNNIDLGDAEWAPLGSKAAPFTGIIDGNGNTISGVRITESSDYVGFIGYNEGKVTNLTVKGVVDVMAADNAANVAYIGGLVGYNAAAGEIINCRNEVVVDGRIHIEDEAVMSDEKPALPEDSLLVQYASQIETAKKGAVTVVGDGQTVAVGALDPVRLRGDAANVTIGVSGDAKNGPAIIVLDGVHITGSISHNGDRPIIIVSMGEGNSIAGTVGKDAIFSTNDLYIVGDAPLSVTGGKGADSSTYEMGNGEGKGADGCAALDARAVTVYLDGILTLTGGNGGNGYYGKDGANGANKTDYCANAFQTADTCKGAVGGDGSAGKPGGAGGVGGQPINSATLYAYDSSEVRLFLGNGGNGGAGGKGGDGGKGQNGADAWSAVSAEDGHAGGNGGKGGAGGVGGNGGNPGEANDIEYKLYDAARVTVIGGDYGKGGAGGKGGNGGAGGKGGNSIEHYTIFNIWVRHVWGGNGGAGGAAGAGGAGGAGKVAGTGGLAGTPGTGGARGCDHKSNGGKGGEKSPGSVGTVILPPHSAVLYTATREYKVCYDGKQRPALDDDEKIQMVSIGSAAEQALMEELITLADNPACFYWLGLRILSRDQEGNPIAQWADGSYIKIVGTGSEVKAYRVDKDGNVLGDAYACFLDGQPDMVGDEQFIGFESGVFGWQDMSGNAKYAYITEGVRERSNAEGEGEMITTNTAQANALMVGGICGYNAGTIESGYNVAAVNVKQAQALNVGVSAYAGGISGYNTGKIRTSYNIGSIYSLAISVSMIGYADAYACNVCFNDKAGRVDDASGGSNVTVASAYSSNDDFRNQKNDQATVKESTQSALDAYWANSDLAIDEVYKTSYEINTEFDEKQVSLSYNNERVTLFLSRYSFFEADTTTLVTVTYKYGDTVTCVRTFPVRLTAPQPVSVAVHTMPKTSFALGDVFSFEGLTLKLTYTNGQTKLLSSKYFSVDVPDMSSLGTRTVTVIYTEDTGETLTCDYEIVIEGCLHKRQRTVPAESSTCSVQGHGEYTECMDCGEVIKGSKELLPLLSHVYDDAYDADCNLCGEKREVTPNLPEDAPAFVMDNVSAAAGDTFTMAIRTERNSGIVSFKLNLTYDPDVLELISVEEKDFIGMSFSPMGNPFIINWVDALRPNNTTNGVVLLVTFRVKEDAPAGVSDITLSYDPEDVYDQNFDNVAFRIENGSVKVVDYIPGDVNSDGKVNNKDLGRLQQYVNGWDVSINASAADVNGDGKVNNKDLGRLQQYVNGWDVELG